MPIPRPHPQDRRSGFALLITITLLAFLVLLLVSLASLTRVETQVASNNQQLSQARQNALMALNLALGRLQALAGPDQRITATAEIVSGVHDDKRKWTGVWNTTAAAPVPEWLVSTTAAAPLTGTASVTTAMPGAGTVPLVSSNSVDTSVAGNSVVVETQPITSTSVPGVPGSQTIGNFAYWVGDEGVKAKVSLGDPWKNATANGVSTTDADTFSFFGAQRSGIEGVSSTGANSSVADKVDAAYPASTNATFRAALPKVLSLPQLPISYAAGEAMLTTTIKNRFHDLTASSYSVLADVSAGPNGGGLKKDLTAWIGRPADSPASSDLIPLESSLRSPVTPFTPYPATERYGLPKWGIIRDYAKLLADGTAKAPALQTDETQRLFPIVTFAQLGLGATCPGVGQPFRVHLFPQAVLWNSTNVTIAGSFELCIGFPGSPSPFTAFRLGSSATPKTSIYLGSASTVPTSGDLTTPPVYFRFPLNLPPQGIAPGQSLFFTLTSSGPYVSGTNAMGAWDPVRTDLSATIDGDSMTAADMTQNVFCNLSSGNMDVLLCPPSSTTPSSSQLIASAYQAFHIGDGYGLPWLQSANTSVSSIPMGPASNLVTALPPPVLAYRFGLNMSRNQGSTTTPRWLATLNPHAGLMLRRRSNFCFSLAYPSALVVMGNECSAANGVTPSVGSGPVVRPVLTEFQPPGVPLFSLAQLQHSGLSLISVNPTYAVGNSYADYYAARDQTSATISASASDQLLRVYDLSYLLNQALWDRYFFSTVPTTLATPVDITTDYHLPNSRHKFHWRADSSTQAELDELKTTAGAAAHLLVNGGFNVNSTSIQAWRALLYSHNGPPPSGAAATEKHPFSRFARPVGTTPNSTWEGYRVLTDTEIDNLAANIVQQVKNRGPFLSLADFVNRRLVDVASTTEDERLKGTLQAALDSFDNGSTSSYSNNVNFRTPFRSSDTAYRITSYEGAVGDQRERYQGGADASAPYASLAAAAPGFLTQADLLNAFGPVLTARSDTFRIRAYGDVRNPMTTNIEGKAWCEAIVQRLPDYVETSADDPWATPATNSINEKFGRRFKIVSFRWLSSSDI
ncbi:MAG: hypothetical protein K0R17_2217 [Rariglobus sp.]|jgi:hypothetical protein|nr:hypothetical protein [Rariglobus sp.]